MSGKGDAPRPYSVSLEEFDKNWDAIFNNKESKEDKERAEFLEKQMDLFEDACNEESNSTD